MTKLEIIGQNPLHGEIEVSGAKNAVLPILAATLLSAEPCQLSRVPNLRDVNTLLELLGLLGAKAQFSQGVIEIDNRHIHSTTAPYDLVKTMRASVLVLGPLLARFGEVSVSLPGGCAIGARPIDQHLKGLEKMGAEIHIEEGYVHATAPKGLHSATIVMDMVTVTGTENLLMAASLARGHTVLENAAREPEVDDLARQLQQMGAKISGIGSSRLEIEGVEKLHGCQHQVMADRIVAATYLVGAAMTGGQVTVRGARHEDLEAALSKLTDAGAQVDYGADWIRVDRRDRPLKAVDLITAPHPGFPTDLQAQFMALNSIAEGSATIEENIFENRFMHVPELMRMGADIHVNGKVATVRGVTALHGAPVMATDLRASASLVLAGLAAQGKTTIERIYHLDRGYEAIETTLTQLGANIKRLPTDA